MYIQFYSFLYSVKALEKAMETYFNVADWDVAKVKPSFRNFYVELAKQMKI